MKNILVRILNGEGQNARLRVALGLARALSAELTCLHETIIPESFADRAGPVGILASGLEEERKQGDSAFLRRPPSSVT
ncbi:hypothetical protein [Sphingomonas oryzagri]